MRLSYRGVHYNQEPTAIDLVDSNVSGEYRGQHYKLSYPRHIPTPNPNLDLSYRGVAYQANACGIEPGTAEVCSQPAQADALVPHVKRYRLTGYEAEQAHRQNIRRRLQHRIDVARSNRDSCLLRQLEQEMELFA